MINRDVIILEKNTDKKYISISIIFVLFLLLVGISATYAFFTRRVESSAEKTKSDVLTGVLDIDFITNKYIHNTNTQLINDEDIFEKADKSMFTIQRSVESTVDNIFYNLHLDILILPEEFKSKYVKWALYNTDNPDSTSVPMSKGTFENIGNIKKIQLNQTSIDLQKNDKHNYTLYMWLSYSDIENQNYLLEKELEVKISAEAVTY